MFGEVKTLFDNNFFEKALNITAINNSPFIIRYFSNDSRIQGDITLFCFIGIKGERFDGNEFFDEVYQKGVRVFLLQRLPENIPNDAIIYLVDDTIQALSKLAQQHKLDLMIPHILITGSVGKTTTRLMIAHVLKEKFPIHTARKNWNNHIGVPLTILETGFDAKISILEAGMNHKGEIAFLSKMVNPDIAIITNIGTSHVGMLGSIDQVAEAKIEIVEGMGAGSLLLINIHDPYKDLFISRVKGAVKFFDPQELWIIEDKGLDGFIFGHQNYPNEEFFCPIPGNHLLLNLAILFTCVEVLQVPIEFVRKGLANIQQGLDNRMRVFVNDRGITVIADCYNASLESFSAALDVLSKANGRKIAVIGSILELGQESIETHCTLGQQIQQSGCADLVLAVGEEMNFTCLQLKNIPYCHFTNKEELWAALSKEIKEGDTVLVKASNGIGLNIIVDCLRQ